MLGHHGEAIHTSDCQIQQGHLELQTNLIETQRACLRQFQETISPVRFGSRFLPRQAHFELQRLRTAVQAAGLLGSTPHLPAENQNCTPRQFTEETGLQPNLWYPRKPSLQEISSELHESIFGTKRNQSGHAGCKHSWLQIRKFAHPSTETKGSWLPELTLRPNSEY